MKDVPFELFKTRLGNGLKLIVAQRKGLPIFYSTLCFHAGAIYEPSDRAGLAEMVSRMLEAGTKRLTRSEIAESIEMFGGRFITDIGYYTSIIGVAILSTFARQGLQLIAELAMQPTFPEKEFEIEKSKLLSELAEKESDPHDVLSELFRRVIYGDHPLGRPHDGLKETVSQIERDDLIEFWTRFYAPNNAILVITSDLEIDEVIRMVEDTFGGWQPKPLELPQIVEPVEVDKRIVKFRKMDVNQAFIAFGHLGPKRADKDWNGLRVASYILGGSGFTSRMYKELRVKRGFAYSAYAYFVPGVKLPGFFNSGIETVRDTAFEAVKLMLQTIEEFVEHGPTVDEVELAKSYYQGSIPRMTDTYSKIGRALLDTEIYGLEDFFWLKDVEKIQQLSVDDIHKAAIQHIKPEKFRMAIVSNSNRLLKDLEKLGFTPPA